MKKIIIGIALNVVACIAQPQLMQSPEMLLSQMTLQEKIGQLIIVAAVSNEEQNKDFMATQPYTMDINHIQNLITNYHIGGIIFLGTVFTHEMMARINQFQQLSAIPLLITLDAEWPAMRLANLDPALQLPHHMTLGALNDNALIEQVGYTIGMTLALLGVHMNLAPVADVNNNAENPIINDRSFGANPDNVAAKVIAYMQGLLRAGIIPCAKHFPGHGDTNIDSHYALPIIAHDRARLDAIELVPFRAAIENLIPAIMTAHIQIPCLEPDPAVPATLSKKITTDLLRNELGFNGLIITDGLGMKGVTDFYESGAMEVKALQAGADIPLCPVNVPNAIAAIEAAVLNGQISEHELDQKVLRVLHAKEWAFAHQKNSMAQYKELHHRSESLKKIIYEKAITIVKDTLDPRRDKSADEIVEIIGMNKYKRWQFGIPDHILAYIKKLKQENKPVTVVLYGSPYAVELVHNADRIIVAYEDTLEAHTAVAQVLAGTLAAQGNLPV